MTKPNACGTCTACCRVYAIPELDKPAGPWCSHCAVGKGCTIYDSRPSLCVEYKCLWLQSRERDPRYHLGEELRPDRSKVVFSPTTDDSVMAGITLPGAADAWRKPNVRTLIDQMIRSGMRVVVGPPASIKKTMIDRFGEHEVELTPPDENGMQWSKPASA